MKFVTVDAGSQDNLTKEVYLVMVLPRLIVLSTYASSNTDIGTFVRASAVSQRKFALDQHSCSTTVLVAY